MGPRLHSDRRGTKPPNEGQRLLWTAMAFEDVSQAMLSRDQGFSAGRVGKWLRGDCKPDGVSRAKLKLRFAIPFESWDEPAHKPFELPKSA